MTPEPVNLPEDTQPKPRPRPRPRWTALIVAGVVLLLVGGLAGRPTYIALRTQYGLYRARKALEYVEQKQWIDAMRAMADGKRFGRDHPESLRATLTFVTKTNHDPQAIIFTVRQLAEVGQVTLADQLLLGQSHLALSDITAARAVFDALSAADQDSKEGLELLAQIYRNEGRPKEAEDALRRAMAKAPDDPDSRLRIALLDYGNAFPEIQARARRTMWELTQADGRTSLIAIRFLAQDKNLTAPEAERLLVLINDHPEGNLKDRLDVLSGIIKLIPQRRDEIIASETAKVKGSNAENLIQVIAWLAKEKQHTRILQLVPMKQALQSPQIFPYVAQALGEENRWADLRRLILSGERLPVPKARTQVWLAEAATHLEKDDFNGPRQYLEEAVASAVKTDDGLTLQAASMVSERLGLYNLAIRSYQKLAELNPKFEVEMLDKVFEMAQRQRDTALMLKISKQLHEKRPTHGIFRDRVRYLKLLIGIELEQVDAILTDSPPEPAVEGQTARLPFAFLRALSAWRQKDFARLKTELTDLIDQRDRLNPGQRAVLAGLFQHVGQGADAFLIGENIPTSILLAEEQAIFAALAKAETQGG